MRAWPLVGIVGALATGVGCASNPAVPAAPGPVQPGIVEPAVPAGDAVRPPETAASVTRGELAALIGTRLERVIVRAPRLAVVATDIRGHWAERWILAVTQAGVMDVLPNHTFQPSEPVRRDQLAAVVSALLEVAAADRPKDLAHWTSARPQFSDLPSGHLFYREAAVVVTAGAMTASSDGRFQPAGPASAADVARALSRIDQLAAR